MSKTLVKKHSWLDSPFLKMPSRLDVPIQKWWKIFAIFYFTTSTLNPNLVALHWGQWGSYVLNWPVSSLKIQGSWERWMEVPQRKEGREGAMFPVERRGGGHSKIKSRKPWAGADGQSWAMISKWATRWGLSTNQMIIVINNNYKLYRYNFW